jgi:type IV pilus assembly protein PilM
MAKTNAVWGIDIGQCALKALRCVPADEPGKITAVAFDFIEYPKILSQPEADPVELVRDALTQFLSRNKVKDDHVAISVPGQSGLARFIKLPPVESKKIPDIVRYEARQQIPFALEDVVFDWQQMAGGSEEDGFALETEVGLFAMKREQVYKALRPFMEAGVEVDIIQLTPLSLFNFVVFDQMQDLPEVDSFDPKDPPPSTIVVSLGTDTTDLVVTNGYRVWQRNIPLGGNHFTRALTKELKLTFAKAEQLKRNALKAEDPKAVFLAMRPVFKDLVTEVQRSISFFQSVDRTAKIGRVIPLGNAMKLRGLQKFLGQSLGYEVVELTEYRGLAGPGVVSTPAFRENLLSFGVCYGLALQGLRQASLGTNLIPPEIVKDRQMRSKKPWAVAAVAALLIGFTAAFFGVWRAYDSVQDDRNQSLTHALNEAKDVAENADRLKSQYDDAKKTFTSIDDIANRLNRINERRALWPELLSALSQCFPTDPPDIRLVAENPQGLKIDELKKAIESQIYKSKRIYLDQLECEWTPKAEDWYGGIKASEGQSTAAPTGGNADPMAPTTTTPPTSDTPHASGDPSAAAASGNGPTGEGWIIQLTGHHYHNLQGSGSISGDFVRQTLIKNLETMTVKLPGPDGKLQEVSLKDLGIGAPTLISADRPYDESLPLPGFGDAKGAIAGGDEEPTVSVQRCDIIVQLFWKETPLAQRLKKQQEDQKKPAAGQKTPELAAGSQTAPATPN